MSDLQLSLKKKWFDMTKSGEKTEDYREINSYWFKRLVWNHRDILLYHGYNHGATDENVLKIIHSPFRRYGFKPFESNIMTLGYPKATDKERILIFEHKGIEIGTGKPEWGAEPDKQYFIIKNVYKTI